MRRSLLRTMWAQAPLMLSPPGDASLSEAWTDMGELAHNYAVEELEQRVLAPLAPKFPFRRGSD